MYVEIQTFLPRRGPGGVRARGARSRRKRARPACASSACSAAATRCSTRWTDWKTAVAGFHRQIAAALPIVERHRMPLGIENHKDWRVDQQVALLERYSSEYLGVTLDTGNNLAVLDDPMETVEKLAPVHVQRRTSRTWRSRRPTSGFLLSEVPLGEGMLDMQRIVGHHPARQAGGALLARDDHARPAEGALPHRQVLGDVRRRERRAAGADAVPDPRQPAREPLPRITGLTPEERLALERELVERSIVYARDHLGLV